MADGVVYIKIAKTDKNGINQTNTLQSLNQVTIPYSTGNITYKVIDITEHPTFFLYYVNPAGVEWADRADILYSFSSSYSGNQSLPFLGTPQLTSTVDNQNFFLEGGGSGLGSSNAPIDSYRILTYPQKDLSIRASSSVQFEVEAKSSTTSVTASIRIVSSPLISGQNPGFGGLSQPTVLATTLLSQSAQDLSSTTFIFTGSYDLTSTPPLGTITPGNCIYFQIFPQVDGGEPFTGCSISGPVTFTNGIFNVSSSDATGQQVGLIPEPYFGSNDFNRALDCQPLLNNADINRRHNLYQDIDYSAGAAEPVNFDLLISGSALRAEVQLSNYTTRRHVIPRYEGSKSTSQKLNTWTKGDTGTFGKTPTVESLKTVIAYCDWIGGWPPDRMNASTAHVLYLIDADGNIGIPNTSENSLPNVQGSFQTSERFRISSKTIGSGPEEQFRTVIRGGSRIEPILYTQIGKQPGAEWTSSISLVDIQTTSGSATQNYQNNGSLPIKPNFQPRDRFSLSPGTINNSLIQSSTYSGTGNSYNFYQTPIGVVNEAVTLNIQITNFQVRFKDDGSSATGLGFELLTSGIFGVILFIKTNGNDASYSVHQQSIPPGTFSSAVLTSAETLTLDDVNFSIPPGVLQEDSEISLEYVMDSDFLVLEAKIIGGSYSITQTPVPTLPIITGDNAIWGFYDKANYPYIITSSNAVSESLAALYGDSNVKQKDVTNSGFEPISLPWSIKYGDEFRFEGDERFTHMVKDVYGPNEGSGSRLTPTGSIEVQFNTNLPVSASVNNFNLDHFLIRRYVDDASQIIFEGFKPLQSQGPYILTPEFSTAKLNTNIDDVITNLREKGLITGEEGS